MTASQQSGADGDELPELRAILFDVDGTLYHQKPVQKGMLRRIARAHALRPWRGWRLVKGLQAYRRSQETLRATGGTNADLGREQFEAAAQRSGLAADAIAADVERWMVREPLELVRAARRSGLVDLLETARQSGIRLGVFSDYPPREKLEVLGVSELFDAVAWAQQPEIGVFKPDPKGIQHLLDALGVEPREALYVGDRIEVDAQAAKACGVRCAILQPTLPGASGAAPAAPEPEAGWFPVGSFTELSMQLFG